MAGLLKLKFRTKQWRLPRIFLWALTLFVVAFSPDKGYSAAPAISGVHRRMESSCIVSATLDSTITPQHKPLLSSSFIEPGAGLPHFARLIRKQANLPVKVAFLGGSITHMDGWRGLVMDDLTKTYPQTKFEFLDAGIPSLGSVPHAFRFQTDVLDKMTPDLLFIESAVNDAGNGTTITEQKRALEGIIRHAHEASPDMDMILMAFADEEKNAAYAHGAVPAAVQVHASVAAYYRLPFINLAKEVYSRIHHGEFSWENDFKSLHPAPFGQKLYFNAIKTLLVTQIDKADQLQKEAVTHPKGFPPPMQPKNYAQGHYVDIRRADALQGFQVVDDWKPADKVHTRPGFVHVPVLCGTKPGDQLALKFKGTAVGIAVVSGPDAGVIRYQIDGGPFKTMDLYTRWSSSLHLPWYEILGDGLADKAHVLKLVIAAAAKKTSPNGAQASGEPGTSVRIVHFLVNGKGA